MIQMLRKPLSQFTFHIHSHTMAGIIVFQNNHKIIDSRNAKCNCKKHRHDLAADFSLKQFKDCKAPENCKKRIRDHDIFVVHCNVRSQ